MFNRTKPIRHYFPDIIIANDMLKRGVEKYNNHPKYIIITSKQASVCNWKGDGKLYITPGRAAIMYATGKEPKWYDLNTPSNTYRWDFNETRDLIGALDALYAGNFSYWNLLYGNERTVEVLVKQRNNTWKKIFWK